MKKIWFWRILLVVSFVVTLSGCKVVMEYRLDDCDPTTTIIDSSDTKNDAVLKHGAGNTDGLYAQYSFSEDDYIVCANKLFKGEGYSVQGDPWYHTAQYYIEAADHDDISPLASTSGFMSRSQEMTLTGWFKTSRSSGTIISKSGDSYNTREYRVFVEGGTLKVTFWNHYGSPETFTIASSVADDAWHAFAVTAKIAGKNLLVKKYLDGDSKGSENRQNFKYCTNTSGSLIIGAMQWGSSSITDYFDGYIDEILMTDDVQKKNDLKNAYQEMKAHKNGDGSSRPCLCLSEISPIAEYRFEGCDWTTGAIVRDEIGNYPGAVVQGAHTAPGADYDGGLCNVANLKNEDEDYDRHISLTGNPIPLSGDWTLMLWINFPPEFNQHFRSGNYLYSVIAGGNHDLCWIRQHRKTGVREWGASSNPSAHRATFPSKLTGWHHLAFVGNGTDTNLYVDGAYYNTVNYKQTGSYTRIGTTADSVSTNGRQNLDTQLDELKFYDGALSEGEIAHIYKLENSGLRWDGSPLDCQLCNTVDHYRIEHTGVGLTCQRSDITVRACVDADCSGEYADPVTVTMSPATANTPTWIDGDMQTFTGYQIFQLRQTQPGTVTLGLTTSDPVATNDYRCFDSGVEGDCDIVFYDTGFIFDVPDLTSCQTFSPVSLQAVRIDDTTKTCIADSGFANTNKTVNFWSSYVNPATGTEQVLINGTNVATSRPGTGISLSFDADNATANFTVNYPDAGQLQLDARYDGVDAEGAGLIMLGNDSFTVSPVGLCVYSDDANGDCTPGDASCSVFKKVDESFNLKVKGVCWESSSDTDFCSGNPTTPNFQLNTIPISHNLIAPTAGSPGPIGVTSIDMAAADSGEHVIGNQTVSEVGVFTFTATPPNYFGMVLPTATSDNIGRFIPDHFITSIVKDGVFKDKCTGFAYTGQTFNYDPPDFPEMLITAKGSGGNTTVNYRGDFVKLTDPAAQIVMPPVTTDATNLGADASNLLNLTWNPATPTLMSNNNGTLNFKLGADEFHYKRETNALVDKFTSDIHLEVTSIVDSDLVNAPDLPNDDSIFKPTGTEIRFGRLQLENAHGSELLDLKLPVRAEYFNGTGFVANAIDGCSVFGVSDLSCADLDVTDGLECSNVTLSGTDIGHSESFTLSAPGEEKVGSLKYTLSVDPWLQYDWDADGTDDDPTAKATFGIYKGNPRLIYMRESVW